MDKIADLREIFPLADTKTTGYQVMESDSEDLQIRIEQMKQRVKIALQQSLESGS